MIPALWSRKTAQELKLLNELYLYLGYYTNYFQPVSKLILKTRTGSKVSKKYDKALTPFRRVLAHKDISEKIKKEIMAEYDWLNPADLKRKISRLQDKLLKLNLLKKTVERDEVDK